MKTTECSGYSFDLIAFDENNQKLPVHKFGAARSLNYIFGGASAGCSYVHLRRWGLSFKDVS
jgi:hypothetical protein